MYSGSYYQWVSPYLQERMIAARAYIRKAIREGATFRRLVASLDETQWYSSSALRDYQARQLECLLRWTTDNIPYYRHQIDPSKLGDPFALLESLQYMDKSCVRQHAKALSSKRFRAYVSGGTSGSSGAPLQVKHDLRSIIREHAFVARQLSWAGYNAGEPQAWWRGDMVVPTTTDSPPFWRYNSADNMLLLSSYHLSEATLESYRTALERFDPVLIQAYPSSIGFLATYLNTIGQPYRGKRLRGIVTSSETFLDSQNVAIRNAFGCPVYNLYGAYERVAAIATCERGRMHLLSDYSFTELRPTADGRSELIGTGFHERAMPLIRYRTGDEIEMAASGFSCECGRSFPVVNAITGRLDDYILTPNGRRVTALHHVFKDVPHIAEAQFRQTRDGAVEIAIVPLQGYSESDEKKIIEKSRERIGKEIPLSISTEEQLPRTRNGKVQNIIRTD